MLARSGKIVTMSDMSLAVVERESHMISIYTVLKIVRIFKCIPMGCLAMSRVLTALLSKLIPTSVVTKQSP